MAKKKEAINPFVPVEEQPYKVPENWCWVYIGRITQIVGGGTPSSNVKEYYENGNIPWLSPVDLSGYSGMYISHGGKMITELGLNNSSAKLMPANTVCLSSRAPIGYVVIAKNQLSTNQGFKSFLPSPAYLPEYLYWYLKGNKEFLEARASGTTFLELSGSKAAQLEVPIPPLPEQQRIVDRIESLFAKLDEAKEKAQAVVDGFEQRKSAILHKAFTGELTARWREEHGVGMESWEVQKLSSFSTVVSGYAFSSKNFSERGIPCVKITNVGVGNYLSDDYEYLPIDYLKTYERFCVNHGDILISLTRSYISAGLKVCIYDDEPTALLNQRVGLVKDCNTQYVYYFLRTEEVLNYVKEKSKTTNQPNLSIKDLNMLPVPVATVEEQNEIVCILGTLLLREQQATETAETVLDRIDTMKKAILVRAFRGELGTNNSDEKPAVNLLKKVLAENE